MNHRKARSLGLLWLLAAAAGFLSGCSNLTEQRVALITNLAKVLGTDVKVRGSLGPARFGPSFQADLGARIDIEARTDVGQVNARDLLDLNRDMLELVERVTQTSPPEPQASPSSSVIDDTIEQLVE